MSDTLTAFTEADDARRHAEVATRAADIWSRAEDAPADHLYLTRKRVGPLDIKVQGDRLVLPVRDLAGTLHSLQFIAADGTKRFLTGGVVQGHFHLIGSPGPEFLFTEGFATGAMLHQDSGLPVVVAFDAGNLLHHLIGSDGPEILFTEDFASGAMLHQATGLPVVVVFDAGNLLPVARAWRTARPAARFIICADDDHRTPGNPSLTKATEAARQVGALLAVPTFGLERGDKDTNFNDLGIALGLDAVLECVTAAASAGPYPDFPPESPPIDWEPGAEEPTAPLIYATPFVWTDPAAIPPRRWVYGRHLIRGHLSLTVGPGATGKSALLIADALAMVTGRNLLGFEVHGGPLRVWLWNLEDPMDELQRRIAATCQFYGITPADIDGRLFIDSGRVHGLCLAEMNAAGCRIVEPVAEAVEAELRARRIDALVVDPFVSTHTVPENDNGAMDAVAKRWGAIADSAGCAVEVVHHLRKLGGAEATAEAARGAVAVVAAARSCRVLNRMSQEEAEKSGLDSPRGYFRINHDKENLALPLDKAEWFHLESVDLANGDSVGVVVPWTWPDPFEGVGGADLLAVQKAISGKDYRLDVRASDWVGNAVAEVLGLDRADRSVRHRIGGMVKTWVGSGAMTTTTITDDRRRKRVIVEVGRWADA